MKQLTQGIINCVALILFAAGICQAANQSGALLEINGSVTGSETSQPVDLFVNDGVIHSGVFHTVPLLDPIKNPASTCVASDQIRTDAYVLQAGSPTGCDPGDVYEGNKISPNDGKFSFTQAGSPGYRFDITTHYQCGTISNNLCNLPATMTNTNGNIMSGDSGFLTVTNNGSSTFTGTITLSGRTSHCGEGFASDSFTGTLAPSGSWIFALAQDSSGCKGFTSDTMVGEIKPVSPGTTTNLLPFPLFPLGQSVTLFNFTVMNGVAAMRDVLTLVPGITCDANVSNGHSNTEFFGGTPLPITATCARVSGDHVSGKAAIISNECFDVSGNQFADCRGIDPSPATHPWIGLSSRYSDAADPKNPFYMIEHDSNDDPTNVIISNRPGCTTPPCGPVGGPHHLNGRETVGDQNFSCQVFPTFLITPSAHAGGFITVTGNIGGCPEAASNGLLTFTFEGPLTQGDDEGEDDGGNEGACRQRRISIPHAPGKGLPQTGSPIVLPSSVNVRLRVPDQACVGTFKLSATIIAGDNTLYNSSATFTVF